MARKILAVIVLVASVALALEAAGQTTTGGITGVVRDPGGALIPGATVTATHQGTNARSTAVSNDLGVYALTGLAVGRHTLVAERDGFRTFQHPDVLVRVNDEVRLDIALQVGAISETLTVSGQARTVDTVTGTLKTVVDQERLEQLPLNGRNPAKLLQLVAGVLPDRSDLTLGHDVSGRAARLVERRARQHDQLRARRRIEQRPLQQRAQPDAEPRRACRSSASRPTASAPNTAGTWGRWSTR